MVVVALLIVGGLLGLGLIAYGVLVEAHNKAYRDDENENFARQEAPKSLSLHLSTPDAKTLFLTGFWLLWLIPLVDHLLDTQHSTTANIIWALTIGPHEVGHLICMPFSELIMFLGGTIWQILFWVLLGGYTFLVRRQLALGSTMLMVAGHSFINASVYIGDAQERELPLLFGNDKSRHDWWNILGELGLLEYDDQFALTSLIIGSIIVLAIIFFNIYFLWRRLIRIRDTVEENGADFIGESNQPIIR